MDPSPKLHWTQRVALVRHNLHSARRTGDFTFFKSLQASSLITGTDHVAILHDMLADEADGVLSTLDNLNAGIAYVHQDAFKAVYDAAKATMYQVGNTASSRKSLLRVDISQQRDMADHAIDKTNNSAINLIEEQPAHVQEAVANAWITGTTIIADAVCVCLREMDAIETVMDDFIRLEYVWSSIQTAVDASVSALRGIFNLMGGLHSTPTTTTATTTTRGSSFSFPTSARNSSVSSDVNHPRSRTSSPSSNSNTALGLIKRAFSHGHISMPALPGSNKSSRSGSIQVNDPGARGLRYSISAACPTRMPDFPIQAGHGMQHTSLSTIPATPAAVATPTRSTNNLISPFREKDDYFAFNMDAPSAHTGSKSGDGGGGLEELAAIESLDPLYSPTLDEVSKMPLPLSLRRLSEAFRISTPEPVAA